MTEQEKRDKIMAVQEKLAALANDDPKREKLDRQLVELQDTRAEDDVNEQGSELDDRNLPARDA